MEISGQLYALATLPTWKSPWYPWDRRLGGPQSQYGCSSEEKKSLTLLEIKPQSSSP